MRRDMSKVIVERPRRGGKYSKKVHYRAKDELPKKEGMKRAYRDHKSLNENLAPLKRFFRSRVGKPWNKVFAEVCENIKTTSTTQKHVRDHIKDLVAQDVLVKPDKTIMMRSRWGYVHPLRDRDLYVCPKTHILKEYRAKKSKSALTPEERRERTLTKSFEGLLLPGQTLIYHEGHTYRGFLHKKDKVYTDWVVVKVRDAEKDFKEISRKRDTSSYLQRRYPGLDILSRVQLYHSFLAKKEPYWANLFRLYKETSLDLSKPKHEYGNTVEVTNDGGKTWELGTVIEVAPRRYELGVYYRVQTSTIIVLVYPHSPRTDLRKPKTRRSKENADVVSG